MKKNVGSMDQILRIMAGSVLVTLAATEQVGAWGYVGVLPLLTGYFGFCPAYPLLGLNTCDKD